MAGKTGHPRLVQVVTHPMSAFYLMRGQLAYMREAGFDVTVVASPGPELDETASRERVRAVGIPMKRAPAPVRDLVALARLALLFRRLRPHVVHVSTAKAGLLGGLAARLAQVPVRLFTLRGLRSEGLHSPAAGALAALERLMCRSAQRVHCVSQSVRRRALDLGLAPPGKLVVLAAGSSNGVDASRFQRTQELLGRAEELRARLGLPGGVPVIGFVGRLVRDKGVRELVRAFCELRGRSPELRLLLVGPFESCDAVDARDRAMIEGIGHVVTTGLLEDAAPAYALMDVLVLPTYREGFPNAPLEAAAMELPVVATRVTGCVDAVVDGVTGTLVGARDPGALARAIRVYLEDPDLRRRHGRAGRQRVLREFRPERIWKALRDEYVRLLQWKGLPSPEGREECES